MSSKENINNAKRLFSEVFTDGNSDVLKELLAKDVSFSDPSNPTTTRGLENFIHLEEEYRSAFPDKRLKIDDIIGTDTKVVVRWSLEATNTGPFHSLPASDMPVKTTGISILTFKGKKIQEIHQNWDELMLLECMGVSPAARIAA